MTGTEAWKTAGPESRQQEWQEWYRARASWRRARAELLVQRQRSHQLALMMRRSPDGPDLRQVRRVVRSRPRSRPPAADAGAPQTGADLDAFLNTRGRRRSPPAAAGGRASRDRTPEPPPWVKVPLERLDDRGQAIDDEGDRVLKDAVGKPRSN
jgi:hypothetical protein